MLELRLWVSSWISLEQVEEKRLCGNVYIWMFSVFSVSPFFCFMSTFIQNIALDFSTAYRSASTYSAVDALWALVWVWVFWVWVWDGSNQLSI
jgi:hypothetical protein